MRRHPVASRASGRVGLALDAERAQAAGQPGSLGHRLLQAGGDSVEAQYRGQEQRVQRAVVQPRLQATKCVAQAVHAVQTSLKGEAAAGRFDSALAASLQLALTARKPA